MMPSTHFTSIRRFILSLTASLRFPAVHTVPIASFCWMLLFICLPACSRSGSSRQPAPRTTQAQTQAAETALPAAVQVPVLQVKGYVDPAVPNPGYVGAQACTACHQDRVEECLATSHFQTCRVPELKKLPRGFQPGQGEFRRPGEASRFESFVRGDKPIQAAIEPSPSGQQKVESSIDLVYGANPTSDEVYLSWHSDDSMWELPIAWVWANDCWGASGFDRTASGGDHARPLTLRCFECHNTWFQHMPGTPNVYRREEMILGVTCERCHGPGREHVAYHEEHPDEHEPHSILYPGDLPRQRLIEVCTQCHSNAIRHKGPALSYRPGQALEDHYRVVNPPHPEDDHVANQIAYLRQSQCFQQSEMTCITCHDPHRTASAANDGTFQESCTQCHAAADCNEQPRLPEPVRGKCVECHMRKYVKVNVNFDLPDESYVPPIRRSQHNITVDPVARHEVLLAWALETQATRQAGDKGKSDQGDQASNAATPSAAELQQAIEEHRQWLLDHWMEESKKCESQDRFMGAVAALREALRIDPDSAEVKRNLKRMTETQAQVDQLLIEAKRLMTQNQDQQATAKFQQLVGLKPDMAEAHSRLGTLAAKAGDFQAARAFLRKSIDLDPDDQYGVSMLARLAFVEGRLDEAADLYRQADAIEPYNAKIHLLWGQTLLKAGRASEAIEHLRHSDQIDPRQLETLRLLSQMLAETGKASDALSYAVRMNELTYYRSLTDLKILADIHISAGDKVQAASVANHALQIARSVQPDAIAGIQQWMQENNLPR